MTRAELVAALEVERFAPAPAPAPADPEALEDAAQAARRAELLEALR